MVLASLLLSLVSAHAQHTFLYSADRDLKSVYVAGTFNGWNKDAQPLQREGRTWRASLDLDPGRYTYKFVLDGDTWITDPQNPLKENDGNGHDNSVLLIYPPDFKAPARKGDGVITESAVRYVPDLPDMNWDRGTLQLSVRVRHDDVSRVWANFTDGRQVAMESTPVDEFYDRFSGSVDWVRSKDLSYEFFLYDGAAMKVLGTGGLHAKDEGDRFVLSASKYKPFVVPSWIEKSVFYQIFPDRFENGDRSNDPKNVMPWTGKPTYANRFGGDFAGVRKHLDYLHRLGVSAVYFNPIFKSPSNHRYDATDFLQVDPELGTNDEFANLTKAMTAQGMRTVIDIVFNHTATNFGPFADIVKNGQKSKYTNWYTIKSYPVKVQENPNYVAWFNFPSMPKLNHSNPEVRNYLLGVIDYWTGKADLSGFRLDVGNEVPMDFWREFRGHVKGINPEAWIVGEIWGDGNPWLKGDQWDSVMNYQFRDAVLGFVGADGAGKPTALMNRLMATYRSYPPQVSRNMMNLVGSHDTPRILTLCGKDKDLAKLAAVLQFTWVGAPSIYYGDEIGMEGERDPDNRRGMDWPRATDDNDFLRLYRKLVSIRNASPALQSGDPVPILADDKQGAVAFARTLNGQTAVIVINRSSSSNTISVPLDQIEPRPSNSFVDELAGNKVSQTSTGLSVTLQAKSAAILMPNFSRQSAARVRSGSAIHQPGSIIRSGQEQP